MTVTIDASTHPHYIALLKKRLELTPRETVEEFFSWHDPDSVQKDLLELLFEAMRRIAPLAGTGARVTIRFSCANYW